MRPLFKLVRLNRLSMVVIATKTRPITVMLTAKVYADNITSIPIELLSVWSSKERKMALSHRSYGSNNQFINIKG